MVCIPGQCNFKRSIIIIIIIEVPCIMEIAISVQWSLEHETVSTFTYIQTTQENSPVWGSMNTAALQKVTESIPTTTSCQVLKKLHSDINASFFYVHLTLRPWRYQPVLSFIDLTLQDSTYMWDNVDFLFIVIRRVWTSITAQNQFIPSAWSA